MENTLHICKPFIQPCCCAFRYVYFIDTGTRELVFATSLLHVFCKWQLVDFNFYVPLYQITIPEIKLLCLCLFISKEIGMSICLCMLAKIKGENVFVCGGGVKGKTLDLLINSLIVPFIVSVSVICIFTWT